MKPFKRLIGIILFAVGMTIMSFPFLAVWALYGLDVAILMMQTVFEPIFKLME